MRKNQDGSIMVTVLTLMIFLTTMMMSLAILANANLTRARSRVLLLQAQYSAESGADAAIAILNGGNTSYTGTTTDTTVLTTTQYKSTYATTVTQGNNAKQMIIVAIGKVYAPANSATPKYSRRIRVTAERSTTSTASSLVSRNILAIASSVKDVNARDIYVNGYITTAKNTTNLTAENITVGGKNTGATNCSIDGPANLLKPATFSTPGQTKTNINVAYNNCITPPGNVSNSNFNVTPNQTSISTIQSLYIPWSQFMDNTYLNSTNGCSDWTTGASPRTIPSTGNTKKTHYPDSGSGISTSCGTNGDIDLGSNQYNISDNVHLRASLCAASACDPTFYNPSATTRFVFVEGSINFQSLQTASGSGPIVFVVYGADPASKTSVCPYGGAVYLGQHGSTTTNAKAVYFLAMNGVCLDGTKFGSNPALGGLGGKNIYIASQSGQPFDLPLDPTYPVSQIPIDLAWRQTGYERF